jgi:hypothetical protein
LLTQRIAASLRPIMSRTDTSLVERLREFDSKRPSLPGEHWAAFALGLYLLLARRSSVFGRAASVMAGGALVARALSGRDGAIAMLRREGQAHRADDYVDVAMPWPYQEPVRIKQADRG